MARVPKTTVRAEIACSPVGQFWRAEAICGVQEYAEFHAMCIGSR